MFRNAIGKTLATGIIAGLAGTAAMTLAQMLEMKLDGRKPSRTPAKAVEKLLHVKPEDRATQQQLSAATHWAYGTSWGGVRAALALAGVRGGVADLLYFGLVCGTELWVLPALKLTLPVSGWTSKQIAKDLALHGIYAAAVGATFAALQPRPARGWWRSMHAPRRRLRRIGRSTGRSAMKLPRLVAQLRAASI